MGKIKKEKEKMGQIGNAISYAPASNVVSTDIPKYNNGKCGTDKWDDELKTTNWWKLQNGLPLNS
jgi:hypothetical protein